MINNSSYRGKEPDYILEQLKEEMAECKIELSDAFSDFEYAKEKKDNCWERINSINSDISSTKSSLSSKCHDHKWYIQTKSWTLADWAKDDIIRYKQKLNSLYSDLRSAYSELNYAKSELDSCYQRVKELKEKKKDINEEYQERLQELKFDELTEV